MNPLNNITYGLYILTTKTDKFNGCVINTLNQVTSNPLQISIAINKDNYTTKMIEENGVFNVSILDNTTTFDLIKHFGFSSGKDVNKFDNFRDYKVSKNGVPYITKHTNAFISGKVTNKIDLGTHYLFIADVTESEILSDTESVTYSYYHTNIKPQPTQQKKNSYVCKICGYVHDGDLPDNFICPICKHGVEVFEKIESKNDKTTITKTNANKKTYYCPICGYSVESETKPDKCIICGAEMLEK